MDQGKYRITTDGKLRDGFDVSTVKSSLATIFNIEEHRLEHLFSGHSAVIKEVVDYDTARTYEETLNRAGLICSSKPIRETEGVQNLQDDADQPELTLRIPAWYSRKNLLRLLPKGLGKISIITILLMLSLWAMAGFKGETVDDAGRSLKGPIKKVVIKSARVEKRAAAFLEQQLMTQSETEYDQQGNKVKTSGGGDNCSFSYDENGLTKAGLCMSNDSYHKIKYELNSYYDTKMWRYITEFYVRDHSKLEEKWIETYDINFKIVERIAYDENGKFSYSLNMDYDPKGRLIREEKQEDSTNTSEGWRNRTITTYDYDSKGNIKRQKKLSHKFAKNLDEILEYDKYDRQSEIYEYNKYDKHNNWTRRISISEDGTPQTVTYREIEYF